MPTLVSLNGNIAFKRGTTAKNLAYTGEAGTISIDTDKKEIRLHDGVTVGGVVANQNAATAVRLNTARNINGVAFDGTADITVADSTKLPLAGGTLTGALTLSSDPTNALHAATKQYVDNLAAGLDTKASVRAATTANITLSAPQTVDGIALVAGDRVLVKNQTTASTNGIYTVQAGAWVRSTDADLWSELPGAFVFVEQGTTLGDSGWVCTVDQGGTLNTTSITFAQFSGAGSVTAGNGIVVSGQQVALATVTDSGTGTFRKVTVDSTGRVTGTSAVVQTDITSLLGAASITNAMLANGAVASLSGTNTGDETAATIRTKLGITTLSGSNTGDQTIALTGDATGSGTGTFAVTLANSGATAGTYRSVTVDAKGRVTSGTNPTTLTGYGITDAQPFDADLTAIAAISGTTGLLRKTAADTWSLDTASYLTANQNIAVTGDATGSGTNAIALTLANTGVAAGTYLKVTVDTKGRVTSGAGMTATDVMTSLNDTTIDCGLIP